MSWIDRLPLSRSRTPQLPDGVRVYAIGDIHGYADLLADILDKVDADLRTRPIEKALLVTLGDYIDRGPDSCRVVDMLEARKTVQECIFLKGNHESFVFDFVKDPSVMLHWGKYGALDTMRSYGLRAEADMTARDLQELADGWQKQLDERHGEFYRNLALSFTCGDYFFTHAGVKPGVSLKQQVERDLIWIREEFLSSEKWFGKMVVHGHTPVPEPDFRPNRINIDTGAYSTGRLTCLMLERDEARVL